MDDRCACGCGATLGPSSVSDYFATEGCQRRWNRKRAGLPTPDLGDPLNAVLDAIQAAAQRRTRREQATSHTVWQQVGYTTGAGTVYTAPTTSIEYEPPPVARWWSYAETLHSWYLMEADGAGTRRIYAVTDETARRAAPMVEDYLRSRLGGHIPPLPTRYID